MNLGVGFSSVGAEAEIKGTTVLQRKFSIIIKTKAKNTKKLEKQVLKRYSKIIKKYLKKYSKIKIYINKKGNVIQVKREENSRWVEDLKLLSIMNKIPEKLDVKNEAIISIKKIIYQEKV